MIPLLLKPAATTTPSRHDWHAQAMVYKEQLRQHQRGFARLHRIIDLHKQREAELERLLGQALAQSNRVRELYRLARIDLAVHDLTREGGAT